MRLRPLTPDDAQACAALAIERGWRPHLEAWRLALTLGRGVGVEPPEGGLAAAAVVVVHGGRTGVLSFLSSARLARRGFGRRAVEAALESAGALPVEVHVPPAVVPFVSRLGFHPAGLTVRFGGRPRPSPRAEAMASLRPVSGTDFPAVVAIDEVAFGALRRPLLEALFPTAARACLAVAGGRTVGYGISWADGETLAVGPVVAEEEPVGRAMIGWLMGSGESEVRLDVPAERTDVAASAYAAGLQPVGRITRLVRGDPPAGRRERLHARCAPWAG